MRHPLDAVSRAEIDAAVKVVRDSGRMADGARFAYIGLSEPSKKEVRDFKPGDPVDRRLRMVIVPGPEATVIEAVVSVTRLDIDRWQEIPDMRPALLIEESIGVIHALRADDRWRAAMARRGIEDMNKVQIDPWPAGSFSLDHEAGRRISRCLPYYRDTPDANGYARPIEGVVAFVDMGRAEVLEVIDTGVVPLPPERGSYYPEDNLPSRSDLRPLEITQPEGPSFQVEGNLVRWQRWSLRVSMDPLEGLVLHSVGYDDGGRVRPILYRASISEMVVPYGSPDPGHAWKSAFDVGEWGLGRMANSLTLGCDCLGEVFYFDADFADERGRSHTLEHAICMHEEDYGILWKHVDLTVARTEVRRSRRLVISQIATVGNYEYGFYWYLYLDGTIQLEVKLTGILSTMSIADEAALSHATLIAPGLAAPYHQHLFNVRLDVEVDGPTNTVYEVEVRADAPGDANPWLNAFSTHEEALTHERQARRMVNPATSRYWKVTNEHARNRLGHRTAYKLIPGPSPALLANPDSSVARRAAFASANLWVTRFDPEERRAAGDHPNQHRGGAGLPEWTSADRSLVDEDVVLWHTFGVTHIPRLEDWPVMPVEYTGFSLVPFGFFDHNPALDLPKSAGHCSD